jgi:lysophospholipase L1-like esterase
MMQGFIMRNFSSTRWLIVLITIFILSGTASAQSITLKAARVSGVTGQWRSVSFGQTITNPIVVAGPLSNFDPQPAEVRVRNVTTTGFQVKAQEWDAQDGVHGSEQLSYVAMTRGRRTLGNGKPPVVLAESTSVTGGGFQTKTFSQPFTTVPIIIATVVTQNEVSAVAVQIQSITTTGFQIRLREQEANAQSHVAETVHYLAWEPGSGTVNGLHYEVGTHGVGDAFSTRWFASTLAGTPVFPLFLSAAQTVVGAETYSIRHRNVTRARVEERLQEDDSFDTESFHSVETVGYLVLGTPGSPGVGKDAVFVSMGDSITFGVGDTVPSDNFQNGTLPPAGYPSILTNRFASQRGKNVLIINEGIPGDRSTDGLGDVANIVNAYSAANYFLLLYGANDVLFNVPSGVGLHSGQPGFLGSFKGNMQQIINAIKGVGKIPVLAKVLYQTNPSVDPRIQQYNEVIKQLITENNLTVTPPDFYTFFKTNPNLLPDGLHPNGVGYQSMSPLWYNSLVNVVLP